MKPVYEWKWQRSHNKHFLVLLKDGKKIGSARDLHPPPRQCSCGPDYNCYGATMSEWELNYPLRFVAYVGGKSLGEYPDMVSAKIAVERDLKVSTKQDRKTQEPERIKPAHMIESETYVARMTRMYGSRWQEFRERCPFIVEKRRKPVSPRTQRKRDERAENRTTAKANSRLGIETK